MSAPRREWIDTFTPEVLSDLRAAIHSMMRELDDCDPERCPHPEQMCWPIEVYQYIEREKHIEGQKPVRFEKGQKPYPKRDERPPEWNLARAG